MKFENASVVGIPPEETYLWILHKHYARRIPSISYAYGIYFENILKGICTIGKPASNNLCEGVCGKEYKEMVYELNRVVIDEDCPNNTGSYFISRVLKLLPDMVLVSYADKGMNHVGKIYQSTNWLYTGSTKERTDIMVEGNKHGRHYKKNADKTKRMDRTSKHRYVYFVGDKRFKKKMLKELKYNIQQYPQGKSSRYDSGDFVPTQIIELWERIN